MKRGVFAFLSVVVALCGQGLGSPQVTNVRAAQRSGTKLVDITYDLANAGGNCLILVEISVNAGKTWDVPVRTISGAVGGNVSPGANKVATWNAGADFDGNLADQCRSRVTAYDAGTPAPPPGMVFIPAGSFQMGSALDGGTPRIVTISNAYFIDRTEITGTQAGIVVSWGNAHGYDLPNSFGSTLKPANYDWPTWVQWANARSEKEGLRPCYYTSSSLTTPYRGTTSISDVINSSVDWEANGYRLPTSAEWEKAARGGLTGKRFPWGDTITHDQANYHSHDGYAYDISSTRGPHPLSQNGNAMDVGSFAPNGLGLYDVVGNQWEWTWDGSQGPANETDPRGYISWNGLKILKGGHASHDAAGVGLHVSTDMWISISLYNVSPYYGSRLVRKAAP